MDTQIFKNLSPSKALELCKNPMLKGFTHTKNTLLLEALRGKIQSYIYWELYHANGKRETVKFEPCRAGWRI